MGFEIEKEKYAGSIKPITIGKGEKAVTVGGNTCLPFYLFEGDMPNKPKIAMEVWDMVPDEWPEAATEPFKDVLSDPAAWAKKCVEEYGADIIVLQLKSTDPNDKDATPEEVVKTVKSVLNAINVPLVLWGTANNQKDEAVLRKVSESFEGENLVLGPVEEPNHKGVGASALGYGHMVIASSPIDINLAKQINILLENLGVSLEKMVIDPTTGGLGYGMEYSFSIMERIMLAALDQGDDKLQLPMINNLGNEVWRCKEAKETADSAPYLGDPERRDILMEVVGAVTYLIGSSSILILRHPESVRLVKSFIDLMVDGGSAQEVAPINKRLQDVDIDFAQMAPEPDLTIEEEQKPAAKKEAPKKEAPKKEEKPAAKKKAAKKEETKKEEKPAAKKKAAPKKEAAKKEEPKKEEKPAAEAKPKEKEAVDEKAEAEAKAKAEEEAKAKAEEEAKKKAEEEEKKKAEEKTAKKKAAQDAEKQKEAEERAKIEAEQEALREQRAKEREERKKKQAAEASGKEPIAKTPAAEQKTQLDKIVEMLDMVHRRA